MVILDARCRRRSHEFEQSHPSTGVTPHRSVKSEPETAEGIIRVTKTCKGEVHSSRASAGAFWPNSSRQIR